MKKEEEIKNHHVNYLTEPELETELRRVINLILNKGVTKHDIDRLGEIEKALDNLKNLRERLS